MKFVHKARSEPAMDPAIDATTLARLDRWASQPKFDADLGILAVRRLVAAYREQFGVGTMLRDAEHRIQELTGQLRVCLAKLYEARAELEKVKRAPWDAERVATTAEIPE